jgi:outer membrane receptor protein involved in Fe transport
MQPPDKFRYKWLALALSAALAGSAFAQDNNDADEEEDSDSTAEVEKLEVTGSRIKRNELEGASPIQVLTSEQIEAEGFSTVYDALNSLTQQTGGVQNELTQSGFTPNANVIDLRGLGPGRVLYLVNGRRAADYPLPYNGQSNINNFGSIPSAAVQRIEVLAGGASAIYGSDAVSGVVNVILKKNYSGNELMARIGSTTRGGGDSWNVQWVGGATGDDWSLTYAFEHLDRDQILAGEREFMDSYRDDPTVDPSEATGVSAAMLRDRLNGNVQIYPAPGGLEEICGRFPEFEAQFRDFGERCYYFSYPATQSIRNSDSNTSAYAYFTKQFGDNLLFTATANIWDQESLGNSATEFWAGGLYFDPQFGSIFDTQRIFTPAETGGGTTVSEEQAVDLSVSVAGWINNRFEWEATVSRSQYDIHRERPRLLEQETRDYFLGEQLGLDPIFGAYPIHNINLDRYFNPITPDVYRQISTTVITDADSSSTQASFELTGDLFEMPAGPAGFAGVLEWGTQEYELIADPRILPGQNVIYNLTGTGGGGDRDRWALGAEFLFPLHETLDFSVAARFDQYDDITNVDDALTWNAGLQWRPIDSLLLRASASTSFRAPDMHYVFADESGFFSGILDEYQCRVDGLTPQECNALDDAQYEYTAFGVRQGNPELEEEDGESWTAGFVWDATDNISMSVDFYSIELEGVVGDISSSYILENEANCRLGTDLQGNSYNIDSQFCQFILGSVIRTVGGPDDGQIEQVNRGPINRAVLTNDGVDASFNWNIPTDNLGRFNFNLTWSHILDQEFAEFEDEEPDSYRDDLTNFDFRSRIRGSVGWQYKNFSTTVFGTRWGSLPNWEETGRIRPHMSYNLNMGYAFTPKFRMSLIVNNVLDDIARDDDTFFSYPFFWRAFSPVGREVFLQANYIFN